MAEPVCNNPILFSHQCGNDRLISGKTGDKQQRPGIAEPLRQLFFQCLMSDGITADMARAAATDAKTLSTLLPRADNLRMVAQAKVVVAGEIQILATISLQPATGALRHRIALTPRISTTTRR